MMFSAKKRKTEEWPQVSQTDNLALSHNQDCEYDKKKSLAAKESDA